MGGNGQGDQKQTQFCVGNNQLESNLGSNIGSTVRVEMDYTSQSMIQICLASVTRSSLFIPRVQHLTATRERGSLAPNACALACPEQGTCS